jgi:3-hydroxy-9,10-secoandrosta-1,3,5(10)-triene-9,17-dione monooxygenase
MFSIVDNWSMIGMQGTGSRRVVASGVQLPQRRVLEFSDAEQTRTFIQQPGRALHPNPMYSGPVLPFLFTELATVAVGAARGALDIYDELLRGKKSPIPPFRPRVDTEEFQRHFGEAQGLIDTAEAALLHLGASYPELGRRRMEGVPPSLEEERRFQRVTQHCVDLAWQAVDLMLRTSGTSVTRKTSQLARYFRNLAVIRTHITLQAEHTSTNIGRLHFGLLPLSTL